MGRGPLDSDEDPGRDDEESEASGHLKGLVALVVLVMLVVAGVVLADRLRTVSRLQDCMMSRATNCADVAGAPPSSR